MPLTEPTVAATFAAWLERHGWTVACEVDHCDIVATKGKEKLLVEVKGETAAPGTDADTAYGQLLRRMVWETNVRYAVVGPASAVKALLRVPGFVRHGLGIRVFEVTEADGVVEHDGARETDRANGDAFDPHRFGVLVRPEPSTLGGAELVRRWTAHAIPLRPEEEWSYLDDRDIERAVADIEWEHAALGEAANVGVTAFELTDGHSEDLGVVYATVFDPKTGVPREEHGLDGGIGSDLLYIVKVTVGEGHDFARLARWLIEYVITAHAGGCDFATYHEDPVPDVALRSVLLERAFKIVKSDDGRTIYVADLALKRPPLEDGEVDAADGEG